MKLSKPFHLFLNDNPQWATFVSKNLALGSGVRMPPSDHLVHDAMYPPISRMNKDELDVVVQSAKRYRNTGSFLRSALGHNIYKGVVQYHDCAGRHFNASLNSEQDLAFGLEIEMFMKNNDLFKALTSKRILSSNWFSFSYDASLHARGVEMKTLPLPANVACNPALWRRFCSMMSKYAYSKSDASSGLHVHVNIAYLSPCLLRLMKQHNTGEGRAKLLLVDQLTLLYKTFSTYNSSYDKFINSVFDRTPNGYCRIAQTTSYYDNMKKAYSEMKKASWAKRRIIRTISNISREISKRIPYVRTSQCYGVTGDLMCEFTRGAVNFNTDHRNTIEFRQGNGTLDPQRIHMILVFIKHFMSLFKEVTQRTDINVANVTDLAQVLMSRCSKQTESQLLRYLARKYGSTEKVDLGAPGYCPLPWTADPINPKAGDEP